ncbi:hypothetical protein [Hydrotalea sp.]|uniref:hypothetical protein n=1 Tax=Hydrotalea sp. TaxID=2881279 RepID=UPI00261E3036|nr:hypothetical protein [Hydrotalea sp.]
MKHFSSFIAAMPVVALFLCMAIASTPPKAPSPVVFDGIFSYKADRDEVVKNTAKVGFIKNSVSPSIVLRVPHVNQQVLEQDKNTNANTISSSSNFDPNNTLYDLNVYNTIEKELLKGGFTVRDRALFDKVLGDKSVSDYSKIKELTETDLILELSNIQYVPYAFNEFSYHTKGRHGVIKTNTHNCAHTIYLYGLKIEFKLIRVKDNDYIGSFTYNYSPCNNAPCNYLVSCIGDNCSEPYIKQGDVKITAQRLITRDVITRFVKESSQNLVKQILE